MIFTTPRLLIRKATPEDADLFFALWSAPRVMTNVGFPQGLGLSREQILTTLQNQGESPLGALLVVELNETGAAIGECFLGKPDAEGVSETDVKLLPEHWGSGYGVEIKRGLVEYLFTQTDCQVVQATPNVNNLASIRMQEAVGGRRVGEGVSEPPEDQRDRAVPVHYYVYRVYKADWDLLSQRG